MMTRSLCLAALVLLPVNDSLGQPKSTPPAPKIEPGGIKVSIRVILPVEKAEVWIENKPTKQKGKERLFFSPPLLPGNYLYHIRAKWTEAETKVTAERIIQFRPEINREFVLEFKPKSVSKPYPLSPR
jgi:uncharacterized protein (TIGR03000 family)